VVLIPKPDGSPRFCIDYRQLNERAVRGSYPLPRMDDCLDSLGDAHFFSTLDCNAGYWLIPLAEEDKPEDGIHRPLRDAPVYPSSVWPVQCPCHFPAGY